MRTGTDYLAALQDDREAYIDGQRVRDVASHPAFAPIAATVAELFDLAADPATAMTYPAPETGEEANLVYSIPRSQAELASRRRAIQTWARHTHGWVGRGPDHVGSFLAGFAAHPEAFAAEPHDLAANVASYYAGCCGKACSCPPRSSRRRSPGPPPRTAGTASSSRPAWPQNARTAS